MVHLVLLWETFGSSRTKIAFLILNFNSLLSSTHAVFTDGNAEARLWRYINISIVSQPLVAFGVFKLEINGLDFELWFHTYGPCMKGRLAVATAQKTCFERKFPMGFCLWFYMGWCLLPLLRTFS